MTMTAAVAAGVAEDLLLGRRRFPRLDDHSVNGQRVRDDHIRELPVDQTRSRGLPYLARVPGCEPPFDDEIESPSRMHPTPRQVAPLPAAPRPAPRRSARTTPARVAALGVTSRTAAPPPLVQAAGVPAWSEEADIGVRLTTTADLPSAERSASVLARAVIEVLSGRRSLGQLRVHCAPDVYAGLADRPTFASAALPHLVSVRVCEPADGVAEVSVAYRRAERVRALAFRIQGVDGRWRMTALQLC